MARKILTEQEKKKRKKKRILILILLLVIIGGVGFVIWKNHKKPTITEATVIDEIKTDGYDYGYSLTDLDSEYYKEEFGKLKEILTAETVDETAYIEQLARCFTVDLYSLNTKLNKNDIGGLEYVYTKIQDDYAKQVMYNIYDSIISIDNRGNKKYPEVKSVSVVKKEAKEGDTSLPYEEINYYLSKDKKVTGYLVKLDITYDDSNKAAEKVSVVIIKEDDKKYSVVDVQETHEPKYATDKDLK